MTLFSEDESGAAAAVARSTARASRRAFVDGASPMVATKRAPRFSHCSSGLRVRALYWRPMRRPRPLSTSRRSFARPLVGFLALTLVGFVLVGSAAGAATLERRFFSARLGVGVEAPVGWTLSLHTGYPEILVVLRHPDGSRISLSAASTTAADAHALVEQSRRGLEAQHLAITRVAAGPRGGLLVDTRSVGRAAELRQYYLVRAAGAGKRQGVVLTLTTRTETLASAGPAFDAAVAGLQLELPAGAEVAKPDDGKPGEAKPDDPGPDAGALDERARR